MKLLINDRWRIVANVRSWDVQRYKGMSKNKPIWEGIKYCTTLDKALARCVELMIMESEAETPDEALKAIERVAEAIDVAINEASRQAIALRQEMRPLPTTQ